MGNDDRKAAGHGWTETNEVAAFEELCGSHGGLGGEQAYPFALVPSAFRLPETRIVGAEEMHRWLRRWLADAGQTAYGDSRGVATDTRAPLASGSSAVGAQP